MSGDWSVLRGTLEENVAAFGAYLRAELGFRAGPGESIDALRALETEIGARRVEQILGRIAYGGVS